MLCVIVLCSLFPMSTLRADTLRRAVRSQQTKAAQMNRTVGKTFRIPESLQAAVAFWRDIYAKHDRDHVVLHDTEYLQLIYDVVDLTDLAKRTDLAPTAMEEARRDRVRAAKEQVRDILSRLNEGVTTLSAKEQRIKQLFAPINEPNKYRMAMADDRLRSQTGQKDKFVAGVTAAGRYMPMIEKIFKEQAIPWEITRLVFVESMFNLRAYSKVGASGIWQFMAGTARLHGLTRDAYVDERNDPVAATQAAARLLKTDFAALGSWPLAINAYNSGRGRLMQAVARLGTSDIAQIIRRFDHPGYGFASRNFYPEFLAALDVYENARHYFGDIPIDPPQEFDAIVTTFPISFPELGRMTDTALDTLHMLNPGYTEEVVTGLKALPAGYTLKVPLNKGRAFVAAIDRLGRATTQPMRRGMAASE